MRIVLALVLVLSIAGSAHAQRPVDAEIAQVREQVLYASYPDAIAAVRKARMTVLRGVLAVAFALTGCSPATPTATLESECGCAGTRRTTCDKAFARPGPQHVRLETTCGDLQLDLAADSMCQGRAVPIYMTDGNGLVSRGCRGRDDERIVVCGSFDRDFRDRVTHLPIFTVCEVDGPW